MEWNNERMKDNSVVVPKGSGSVARSRKIARRTERYRRVSEDVEGYRKMSKGIGRCRRVSEDVEGYRKMSKRITK